MNKILNELKKYKWIYIVLVGVVMLSAFLRLWELGNTPFVADEFLDVNATYGYKQTGQWQAWDFNQGEVSVRDNKASDERAWLYRWQVAQVLNYFEPTEFTFRLTSAMWGILTTIILYFVTFSFTKNRWIALIAVFLWAVSVPAIEINRKIRMYSMFAPMFLLFSWSLFKFIDSQVKCACTGGTCPIGMIWKGIFRVSWIYLIPAVIFGVISYHLHPLVGNIVIMLLAYFVIMLVIKRKEIVARRYGAYITLMLLGGVVVKFTLPQVWSEFTGSLIFFDDHWSYVGHVMRNYWHPLLGGLFVIVGTYHLTTKQEDERPGVWIASTFFTTLFAAILLWNRNVGPQYIFFIQTFGLILTAAGVYAIAKFTQDHLSCHSREGGNLSAKSRCEGVGEKIFVSIVILSLILLPFYGYFALTDNAYHITVDGNQANYRKVFDYVKRNSTEGDAMITRNFRNYYWSGLEMQVLDFGSERSEEEIADEGKIKKVTIAAVQDMMSKNPTGWIVFSDNDKKFITKEARQYFDDNFTKIDDSSLVRGKVSVYRW